MSKEILKSIAETLIKGDSISVKQLIEQALEGGVPPADIVKESLIPGMETVSVKFQNGKFYVLDVITAADAMQTGIKILEENPGAKKYSISRAELSSVQLRVISGGAFYSRWHGGGGTGTFPLPHF